MNASLIRHSFQDKLFQKFLIENSFDKPRGCSNIPTYHHYNGKDNSQIDYVLQSAPLIDKYLTFIREPLNTSTHDPVMVTFYCNITAANVETERQSTRKIKWNKVNISEYQSEFDKKITEIIPEDITMTTKNSEFIIKTICKTLVDSAEHQSGMKPHRETANRCKKKRSWTPEINQAMKRSKSCFAKWKAEGKPRDSQNRHFKSMKLSKKKVTFVTETI